MPVIIPDALERVLLTLWIGTMWAIGYIAAPVLFAVLDERQTAGRLAGEMFHIVNWLGLGCGIVLILMVLKRYGHHWRFWVLLVMVLVVANNQFVLQPMMQALKTEGLTPGSEAAGRFGMLHGISSILYLLTSVLGLVLVALGLRPKAAANG
jgi:hypothetical protein